MKRLLKYSSLVKVLMLASLLTGCATRTQPGRVGPSGSSLFSTSFIDHEAIAKVSTVILAEPLWQPEAIACSNNFDLSSELKSIFASELAITVLDLKEAARLKEPTLYLTMLTCEERVGSSYGATTPARVGFTVNMFDAQNRQIWSGTFSLKDTAILENLILAREKLKIGSGWLTAGAILNHGLVLAARDFEGNRTKSFLVK